VNKASEIEDNVNVVSLTVVTRLIIMTQAVLPIILERNNGDDSGEIIKIESVLGVYSVPSAAGIPLRRQLGYRSVGSWGAAKSNIGTTLGSIYPSSNRTRNASSSVYLLKANVGGWLSSRILSRVGSGQAIFIRRKWVLQIRDQCFSDVFANGHNSPGD